MGRFRRFLGACLLPAAIFQSVNIGGGYGTGRELVEYFTQYGPVGGFLGLALCAAAMSVIISLTYELARRFQAFEYRSFFKSLIGPFWPAFEILYLAMFLLAVSVAMSASNTIFMERFSAPAMAGSATMAAFVCLLSFSGRKILSAFMTVWSIALYTVLALFLATMLGKFSVEIGGAMKAGGAEPGWARSALQYAFYSSVAVPAILFAVRPLASVKESLGAGVMSAVLFIAPAMLMHLVFLAQYPSITEEAVPAYRMLAFAGSQFLFAAYSIVLFGTLVETGAGVIQGLIERIDRERIDAGRPPLKRTRHMIVAVIGLGAAALLSQFGIIALIAKGYGWLAWGFLLVYIAPLLTIGVWRLWRAARKQRSPIKMTY